MSPHSPCEVVFSVWVYEKFNFSVDVFQLILYHLFPLVWAVDMFDDIVRRCEDTAGRIGLG